MVALQVSFYGLAWFLLSRLAPLVGRFRYVLIALTPQEVKQDRMRAFTAVEKPSVSLRWSDDGRPEQSSDLKEKMVSLGGFSPATETRTSKNAIGGATIATATRL